MISSCSPWFLKLQSQEAFWGFLLLVSHPFPGGTEAELALLPYVGEGPGLGVVAGSAEREEIPVNAAFPNIINKCVKTQGAFV